MVYSIKVGKLLTDVHELTGPIDRWTTSRVHEQAPYFRSDNLTSSKLLKLRSNDPSTSEQVISDHPRHMSDKTTSCVFLHGIQRRSGTNHLNQLLVKHPDCVQPAISVREDWFLDTSDPLMRYADDLFKIWSNPKWGGRPYSSSGLLQEIGAGQLRYLRTGLTDAENKTLVSKTPSVNHLDRLAQFFPGSRCVILVRDPLDVAASAFHTWKTPVSRTLDEWNLGCRRIQEFANDPRNDHFLLRYEDLIKDPVKQLKECFNYLGLDPGTYPWEAIEAVPVLGSSDGGAAFRTVERSSSFQAVGKWTTLPEDQKRLIEAHFDQRGADVFGYAGMGASSQPLKPLPDALSRKKIGEGLQNRPSLLTPDQPVSLRKRLGYVKEGLKLMLRAVR